MNAALIALSGLSLALAAHAPAQAAACDGPGFTVCHRWETRSVSFGQLLFHLAHGDPPCACDQIRPFFADADRDRFGDPARSVLACWAPLGYVPNASDCNDRNRLIHPGALERCNGVDDDCDGVPEVKGRFYRDADGDGYGDPAAPLSACDAPAGFVADGTDCDDTDPAIHPGAVDECNGVDDDCDGTDEATGGPASLADAAALLRGAGPVNQAGSAVAGGDFDGDGVGDALVGASGNAVPGAEAGLAYVAFGPLAGTSSLSDAAVVLTGEDGLDGQGAAVAAGDFDGDGTDDLLIGVPGQDATGAAYVIYGRSDRTAFPASLAQADVKLAGEAAGDSAGQAVASALDVDDDGTDEVLVGAPAAGDAGAAYLVRGGALPGVTGALAVVELATADARLAGVNPQDFAGRSVAAAGDVDADGLADVLVGVQGDDRGGDGAGAACLFYGATVFGADSLADADACFTGEAAGDQASVVAPAGDVDDDGSADFLVGAGAGTWGAVNDLGTAAAARFVGERAGDGAGTAVAGAGDLNGDGFADLLVGAEGHALAVDASGQGDFAGAVYLLYGPVTGTLDLAVAHRKFTGTPGALAGHSLSAGPDFDGDGFPDFLVGAPGESTAGVAAGTVSAVRGGSLVCP